MNPTARVRIPLVLVLALAGANGPAVVAQASEPAARGLDLIVVVDVSASMYTKLEDRSRQEDRPSGSDPERIRWDAVKLTADLLTVDDRLLVQRFNDEAPPAFDDQQGRPRSYLDPDRQLPLLAQDDVPARLTPLVGQQRADLETRIARFNTTRDWLGSTDWGGTRMIHALQIVAQRIGRPAPGRETHVVLLTDGDDNDHAKGLYRSEESLRKALSFYSGDLPGRAPIPIHTIGLGLFADESLDPAADPAVADNIEESWSEGQRAKSLLLRISSLTKGNYYQADTSRELIRVFFSLIRDLKGAWYLDERWTPARSGETRTVGPTPVGGIVDLGMLVFELNPGSSGKKDTTPPGKPPQRRWTGLDGHPEPVAAHRTGKDGSIYDYYYYGTTSAAEAAKSPFAEFPPAARLALDLQGGERTQELILIKRTQQPLFAMAKPEDGDLFFRHQALEVQVAMAESAFFSPEQFAVTARLTPAGRVAEDAEVLEQSALQRRPGQRHFGGRLALANLPQSSARIDYYTLTVTIRGQPDENNSLSGFQLELPPRTISVDNQLFLDVIPSIELTDTEPRAVVNVATRFPVHEDLQLQARFIPFRREGQPLELKEFVFASAGATVGDGGLPLEKGRGRMAIGFRRGGQLPAGGIVYEPGKIVITGGDRVRMEPVEIEVGLRLALTGVAIEPAAIRLQAQPQPVASEPVAVRLSPADQTRTAIGPLLVELRESPGRHGDPQQTEDASSEFSPRELWLQAADEPPISPGERAQSLRWQLGKPFQVYVAPQEGKKPGNYHYEISVSGSGIDPARASLVVSVDAPSLELQEDRATIYVEPGEVGVGQAAIRLKGVAGEPHEVYIERRDGKPVLVFENVDPLADTRYLELRVERPDKQHPLLLSWGEPESESPWGTLPFRIHVPKLTPYGRYRAKVVVTGQQVTETTLTLELLVNRLLVELPFTARPGEQVSWGTFAEARAVQFLGHDMEKKLRIRTGLGEPLFPDDVEITPLRPFADDSGDVMRLPRVVLVEPDERGDAVWATLRFPETPNAHVEFPYRVQVEVRCPALQIRPVNVAFRVRFWDHQQFLSPAE